VTNIWLFYYFVDLAAKCPFPPFLGRFLGVNILNVARYCRYPKKHILGRKHAFWRIDRADRSRNVIWARAEESTKERKNKEKKLRDVTNHIFAQTTHVVLPSPKLSCGVGSRM